MFLKLFRILPLGKLPAAAGCPLGYALRLMERSGSARSVFGEPLPLVLPAPQAQGSGVMPSRAASWKGLSRRRAAGPRMS
ncbi:MAG: hypothetical protein J6S33_00910 [Aeriscardovia sp.]|nr:hypothetical protein [Aeriscardovia sp.]